MNVKDLNKDLKYLFSIGNKNAYMKYRSYMKKFPLTQKSAYIQLVKASLDQLTSEEFQTLITPENCLKVYHANIFYERMVWSHGIFRDFKTLDEDITLWTKIQLEKQTELLQNGFFDIPARFPKNKPKQKLLLEEKKFATWPLSFEYHWFRERIFELYPFTTHCVYKVNSRSKLIKKWQCEYAHQSYTLTQDVAESKNIALLRCFAQELFPARLEVMLYLQKCLQGIQKFSWDNCLAPLFSIDALQVKRALELEKHILLMYQKRKDKVPRQSHLYLGGILDLLALVGFFELELTTHHTQNAFQRMQEMGFVQPWGEAFYFPSLFEYLSADILEAGKCEKTLSSLQSLCEYISKEDSPAQKELVFWAEFPEHVTRTLYERFKVNLDKDHVFTLMDLKKLPNLKTVKQIEKDALMKEFGKLLKKASKQSKSYEKAASLAWDANVDERTIRRYMAGTHIPDQITLKKIIQSLDKDEKSAAFKKLDDFYTKHFSTSKTSA